MQLSSAGSLSKPAAPAVPVIAPVTILEAGAKIRIALSRVFVAAFGIGIIFCRSRWIAADSVLQSLLATVGLLMASLAMAGRLWCSVYIAGRKDAELVTSGPYSLSRNPLYLFSLVGAAGIALSSGMITAVVLVIGAFRLYYPAVIRREEKVLRRKFGKAFDDYAARVPGFFPRTFSPPAAEQWTVHTGIFLKHMGSAVWFPVAVGIVRVLQAAQAGLGLPAWLGIP